ncbi:hypothetical protein GGX14DRAFT_646547, partial [Mycena pura]
MSLEDPVDILNDSLEFLGGSPVIDAIITYGDLQLTVAAKANTLLADHLFSPALFLAERIERGLLQADGLNVVELGAGSALPSLLLSTVSAPPASVVVSDYPDSGILGNLTKNVERNKHLVSPGCTVQCCGYEWGADVAPLLALSGRPDHKYDLIILSDLLHFHSSHSVLISSMNALLAKDGQAHVAAGFIFEEIVPAEDEREWFGRSIVNGLDKTALGLRKSACRYWCMTGAEFNIARPTEQGKA